MFAWKKLAAFAGGVLFGTAGITILKSQDAKGLIPIAQRLFCAVGMR